MLTCPHCGAHLVRGTSLEDGCEYLVCSECPGEELEERNAQELPAGTHAPGETPSPDPVQPGEASAPAGESEPGPES